MDKTVKKGLQVRGFGAEPPRNQRSQMGLNIVAFKSYRDCIHQLSQDAGSTIDTACLSHGLDSDGGKGRHSMGTTYKSTSLGMAIASLTPGINHFTFVSVDFMPSQQRYKCEVAHIFST